MLSSIAVVIRFTCYIQTETVKSPSLFVQFYCYLLSHWKFVEYDMFDLNLFYYFGAREWTRLEWRFSWWWVVDPIRSILLIFNKIDIKEEGTAKIGGVVVPTSDLVFFFGRQNIGNWLEAWTTIVLCVGRAIVVLGYLPEDRQLEV